MIVANVCCDILKGEQKYLLPFECNIFAGKSNNIMLNLQFASGGPLSYVAEFL